MQKCTFCLFFFNPNYVLYRVVALADRDSTDYLWQIFAATFAHIFSDEIATQTETNAYDSSACMLTDQM